MNTSRITSALTPVIKNAQKIGNKAADKLGDIAQGNSKLSKGLSKCIDAFEPNGGDSSFFGLATTMFIAVLAPRIKSALKRNPDNKEATKDEITEIVFRDLQTIAIMLFGLKTLNSIVGNIGTRLSGIPMVDVPYKKLFDEGTKGIAKKAQEFAQHPVEKLKILGSNVLKTLNPIGGSSSLTGEKIKTMYTSYASANDVKKFLNDIPNHGGDKEKVFAKIKNSIMNNFDAKIEAIKSAAQFDVKTGELSSAVQENINSVVQAKKYFENLKLDDFLSDGFKMEKGYEKELINFFADKNNALAKTANRVNDWLRTLALGIEVAYLGFGLPALNQKRLEKKYLKNPKPCQQISFNPITDRHIKAQEIKLYSQFIK